MPNALLITLAVLFLGGQVFAYAYTMPLWVAVVLALVVSVVVTLIREWFYRWTKMPDTFVAGLLKSTSLGLLALVLMLVIYTSVVWVLSSLMNEAGVQSPLEAWVTASTGGLVFNFAVVSGALLSRWRSRRLPSPADATTPRNVTHI